MDKDKHIVDLEARVKALSDTVRWAIEECLAAEKEREEYGDIRALTQPLKGALRATLEGKS